MYKLKQTLEIKNINKSYVFCLAFIASLLLLFVVQNKVSAATIAVSGSCSIDNAIASANNDADTGGCVGSGAYGDDTINIPAGTWVRGTDVAVEDNTVIQGAGMGQTVIDGDNSYRGLACGDGLNTLINFELSGVSIRNFNDGGSGVYGLEIDSCNAQVTEVEVYNWSEPTEGAVLLRGDVSINIDISDIYIHSGIGNALAIMPNGGDITGSVQRVTISDMSGSDSFPGIGIRVITDSSISHAADIDLSNITVANNENFIAIMVSANKSGDLDVRLFNSTIVNNSMTDPNFAMYPSGIGAAAMTNAPELTSTVSMSVQNILLANNVTGNCMAFTDNSSGGTANSSIISLGNNLADDSSCGLAAAGDQQNVANIASSLGPLQGNGGAIPTIALLAGSPAIDSGATIGTVTTDARGTARPQGGAYDIGAFELGQGSGQEPDDDTDSDPSTGDDGGTNGSAENNDTAGKNDTEERLANTGAQLVVGSVIAMCICVVTIVLHKFMPRMTRYILPRS